MEQADKNSKSNRDVQDYRVEHDSMGEVKVPAEALYGAHTQRALENFPISGLTMPRPFIKALAMIKGCAAEVNGRLERVPQDIAQAIVFVAGDVAEGEYDKHFPVDVFQTGSGTSTNMNANEVIARLAGQELNKVVHPNDHVNCGQSSNDVIPTAIQVSAVLEVSEQLLPALRNLREIIQTRSSELDEVIKTGRTHLMDAMPLTFGQELGGWATQISHAIQRIESVLPRLCGLAQGATAVGTGVNAHPQFAALFAEEFSRHTGMEFKPADNRFTALSCQDTSVELSGQLRTLAVSLMKIANDLRWMNSGPLTGLAEIMLPPLQPGSSIMPGKINPVIPEAVAMACAQVMGNDAAIAVAGQSGNFQLNVMLPMIAYNLLQSINLLANSATVLGQKAIAGFSVDRERLAEQLDRNPVLVTALNNIIGYEKSADIAKQAYMEKKPIREVAAAMTGMRPEELEQLLDPANLVRPV